LIEGLRARFMSRFLESARSRVGRASKARRAGNANSFEQIVSEMHALAGEAALLEIGDVAHAARECEEAARRGDGAGVDMALGRVEATATLCSQNDPSAAK